jgi:hypothetical protein
MTTMQNLIETVPTSPTRPMAAPTSVASVIGPEGQRITRDTLPPPNTKRWVIRRKAEVVAAVRGGLLTLEEACERYMLTVEEFQSWQRAIEQHGLPGLRTTRLQEYRPGTLKDPAIRSF